MTPTRNVTARERCRYCLDSGFVVHDTGDPHDEAWLAKVRKLSVSQRVRAGLSRTVYGERMAPCPFCEQGFAEEFGDPDAQTKAQPVTTPWGNVGFWQGRDTSWLRPHSDDRPMHKADAISAAKEAQAALRRAQEERRP